MKKSVIKLMAAFSAAAIMVSSCPPAVYSAASFDSSAYCEVEGSYKNGKVTITWKKVAGAENYKVYRENGSGIFKLVATTKSCTYNDKKTLKDHVYRYKVYAVCGDERSVPSEVLHVGISSKGKAVIYTFDMPKDYEPRYDLTVEDFDIYDTNSYGTPKPRPYKQPPKYITGVYAEEDAYAGSPDGADDYDAREETYEDVSDDYDFASGAGGSYSDSGAAKAPDADYAYGGRRPVPPPLPEPPKPKYYYRGEDQITAGTLTAGRHTDNDEYKQFTKLMKSEEWQECIADRGFVLDSRYTVNVTDKNGKPMENITAELRGAGGKVIFAAKTNNKGTAYIFTGFAGNGKPEKIVVILPDGTEKAQSLKTAKSVINVKYNGTKTVKKQLDIMLTIDSTGSMSDEMKYLEAEFKDVVERVSKDNDNITIRTSVNFYRDEGDEYIYRSYNFRTKADTVTKSIGFERAKGGGDYPEAVPNALDISINKHKWNKDSTKIMFLVLDAPPHYDEEASAEFIQRVAEASAAGIRIIPIVSSGSDTDVEYLMRSAAAATGGTYIFLTDDSGVGSSHAEPSIDQYEVVKLNDLMVKVIDEYLE